MTPPIDVRQCWALHFTHVDNLPGILAAGSLRCDNVTEAGSARTDIADLKIKNGRRSRAVPAGPGGYVGDYVPLYLAPRSPMMYRIACEHRDRKPGVYSEGDRPLVYLALPIAAVLEAGLAWVATDGNAAAAITRFTTDQAEFAAMVDWRLMREKIWRSSVDDPDRQRRRGAELLVHRELPLRLVQELAAYSEDHASRVRSALGSHPLAQRVVVRPEWYYGYERR